MSIKKQYLKDKCKVTFKLDKKVIGAATKASIVAEFNEWKIGKTPMKPLKNGDFTVTVTLDKGREYQYRYVVDGQNWVTDDAADKYVHSGVSNAQNAVVVV
jgi:1,4-alpha-glucan branching enzyme